MICVSLCSDNDSRKHLEGEPFYLYLSSSLLSPLNNILDTKGEKECDERQRDGVLHLHKLGILNQQGNPVTCSERMLLPQRPLRVSFEGEPGFQHPGVGIFLRGLCTAVKVHHKGGMTWGTF